jgi:hypothetical protein
MVNQSSPIKVVIATGARLGPSQDGNYVVIEFRTRQEPVRIALKEQGASLIALLLEYATKIATTEIPAAPPKELTTKPVPVQFIGFAKGESDREAFVGLTIGNLRLTLSLDTEMVRNFIEDVMQQMDGRMAT